MNPDPGRLCFVGNQRRCGLTIGYSVAVVQDVTLVTVAMRLNEVVYLHRRVVIPHTLCD